MHRNRGVLPSFMLVRLHMNRGVQSAFNALYGLHLMHRNRGTDCTVFEVDLQHRNRGNPKTGAFISGTSFKVVRLHLLQAVQYGLDWFFWVISAQKSRTAGCCSCTEIEAAR